MRKQFLRFLCVLFALTAIGGTNSAWAADKYWQVRVKAIHRDGTPADSYVAVYPNGGSLGALSTNDSTMPAPGTSLDYYKTKASMRLATQARNCEVFQGWYFEEECTTLVANAFAAVWNAPADKVPLYTTSQGAEQHIVTIYALFSEPVCWNNQATIPPTAGEYYIFNVGRNTFVGPGSYSVGSYTPKFMPDANNALLFTITDGSDGKKIIIATDGATGTTYGLKANGAMGTDLTLEHTITAINDNTCCKVLLNNGTDYWLINSSGSFNKNSADDAATNAEKQWVFISKQAFLNNCKVKSKNSDGSVLIETPDGNGTAYVSFNVSELGNVSDFEYSLSNTEHWEMVDTTRSGNVITLGVKYTAQGVGDFSTTIVTMSSKAQSPATVTSATATASAAVSFTPVCEMAVGSKLDWSYDGEELKETFNTGMEVAASQRTRTKDKLVYNGDNAIVRDIATWTATITGTNANQFKFANGSQTVSGTYSPELLDVIYAPTTAGTHTATLSVEVSYTTVTSAPVTVTLSGKAQNESSMVAIAVNGGTASNNASLNIGDIIGTNSQDVTVDLYIQGLSNLTKEWSAPVGTFEFDVNTVDLTKANQTLTFRAHRSTAVTEATSHTGTLTIKSNGTTVGTLTLTYTAKPLLTPEVTWNWALLNEDATYSDPLTIVSGDGAWTLEQKDGNGGMTYDAENKTITTEYMHHESGYTATFELNIAQTATYAALTDTLYARIKDNIPPVVEINSQADFDTYVVSPTNKNWVTYNSSLNAIQGSSDHIYFQWSGQSTFAFDYEMSTQYSNHSSAKIYERDENDTDHEIFNGQVYNDSTHVFSVSPTTKKLHLYGSNKFKNVRYFEYDTIDVNYHGVVFVEGGATTRNITATFANKREVTVSLNAAAQEFFELRAEGKPTGSTLVYDGEDGLAVHKFVKGKVFTVAIKDGVNYADAKAASVNGFQVILQDNYTYNSEIVVLPIALEESYQVTYKHDAHGSYKVMYHDDMEHPHTVSTSLDYVHTVTSIVETSCTATLIEPTPTSGYMFRGWKVNGNLVSCKATHTVIPASGATVEPVFVAAEEAVYTIDDAAFADLDVALSTAGSIADTKPVVVLQKDVTLSEPATHTIPAGVTLLIPYKANFNELQYTPEITTTATPLAAYRTLTLKEGVNIVVNGNICVSAKIMAAGGGNKSAYTTDECGVINMANGGHIQLNSGAHLYCWGYIKGQDMDQGNNTVGTGTITVNAGAIVHENFELGDWRGGTASSNIYYERESKHLFPFQSYALQNIEIPTTYTFGSKLETFMVVNTGFGSVPFAVSMIGSQNTLFLLKDAGSVIRKWYDPTTDLCCYELSGTAQLDELTINLPFVGEFKSGDCNLPVSNSMHIILADCNMTLSKRLMVQAGAVLEIKNTATVNLEAPVHLFDKDEWGLYIHNYYFRSFNNLTSHKNRGAENSKDGLEDAKFIIDGTLNVVKDKGYIYSTAGGANLMGNGGGIITFEGALPSASQLWQVTVLGQKPYITWVSTNEAAANLCNEDGSYTRSIGNNKSFINVNGRWFVETAADPKDNHTYAFTYMSNGNAGDDVNTSAVYSHDKTGLEARMKWFNVTADATPCANWWKDASNRFYNYTMLGEWHQFIETETENVYSGSNNVLYRKDGCDWAEEGYIDENCLYTFGDVKKALVDGAFIPLIPNGYDPAYHNGEQYYICFQGCNWHPATPYAGESKAYTINPETGVYLHYIWFNNDWLNVLRDGAFFYTEDEQTNVRTYYEYLNGDWVVATPYVSVTDAAETRNFYMIKEAFNVASIKKNATIKLLRDLLNVSEVLTYSTQNTTCTLDLNGHLLSGNLANLITVNAPSATFTITDNSDLKNGKISSGTASKAVYVQNGALVVANGTIESTGAYAIEGAAGTTITINGGYFAANTKCVNVNGSCSISGGHFNLNAGLATYKAAHTNVFETTDPKYKYTVENEWIITFKNYDESTLQTLNLKTNEMPVYTAAQPTKDGEKFTGWNHTIVPATEDATYMAVFEAIVEGEKCVTLNSNGGVEGLRYIYVASGSAVGILPTATKEGYTFVGWFTAAVDGDPVNAETTVSANVTWYAHYTIAQYTLTWNLAGGTVTVAGTGAAVDATGTQSIDLNYGAAITAPQVTKAGCDFLGWGVASVATTMPAHDVTYTAQWPIIAKHFLQNIDGTYPETPEATDVVSGEANGYVTPAVKTYDGFITPATQTVKIGETDEVRYEYTRRTYTITLNANGGTCATTSLSVKHGATLSLPVATKDGTNCSGWFTKAIGGDQITNETEILYNIGTLYAQYADLNVTAPLTVSDTRTVTDVRITTTGALTITGSVQANNFILESNGSDASGQFLAGYENLTFSHAYFDLKVNAKNHLWYAVAVPWQVDAQTGISVNGRTLNLGSDFDIIYYDGARRATEGKNKCWQYVQNDGDQTLQPGRLYMIGLMMDAPTIRFTKKSDAGLSTTTTSVTAHGNGSTPITDKGWNGVANPSLFYAYLNPGTTEGQVYIPAEKRYEPIDMSAAKMVVGQGAFVQAPANKNIEVSVSGAYAAPRRARAEAVKADVRIAPAEADYTDRLFVKTTDSKETDVYTIGQDLAKVGVSNQVAQMWVDRYGEKLCVNTQAWSHATVTYPLGISIPTEGEYTISCQPSVISDQYDLYLTLDGRVIWNLSMTPYTAYMEAGTNYRYGLRMIAKSPQTPTGIDEAIIDANGETRKVLINNQVFIIREGEVYTVTGMKVE